MRLCQRTGAGEVLQLFEGWLPRRGQPGGQMREVDVKIGIATDEAPTGPAQERQLDSYAHGGGNGAVVIMRLLVVS